jgi:hypothetical protein
MPFSIVPRVGVGKDILIGVLLFLATNMIKGKK